MNKSIKVSLIIFLLLFTYLGIRKVLAVDLTVTCILHGPCNMSPNPGDALFDVSNMLPGDTEKRTITVYNEDPENECRNLTLNIQKTKEDPDDFAEILYTAIITDGTDKFDSLVSGEAAASNTMQDLFDQASIPLGSVPAGGSSIIDWYATFEKLSGNHFQLAETKFDFNIYFECNSQIPESPALTIAKFNSQWPNEQAPGSVVDYTITLQALGGPVYNVVVTDLPPKDFVYQGGSFSATKNGLPLSISEPNYASPGKWYVGGMSEDDIVVLSYKAKIADSKKSGLYKDVAWAYGCSSNTTCSVSDESQVVLAASVDSLKTDSGIITENHVGTKIFLGKDPESVGVNVEKEETVSGEVLGASSSLPATGAGTIWLVIAGGMFIIGNILFFKGSKDKKNKLKKI